MFIAYYDEAGDDGYPKYSSELFVLTALYLHQNNWKDVYEKFKLFRKEIKNSYDISLKQEIHTREFLLNKKPFRQLELLDDQRIELISLACIFLSQCPIKIVNVSIIKPKIKKDNYDVLETI